jgi:Thioesterase-like superfamily
MTGALFTRDGDGFVATGHTRGPWDPGAMHGGAPSALIARAIEEIAPEHRIARLTVEFLGAVPIGPVTTTAEITRSGRRFQVAEATVSAGGREACRARASLLRRGDVQGLPPTDGVAVGRAPDAVERSEFPEMTGEGFALTAMDIRFADGTFTEPGPATAWFRLDLPLVEGEEPSPAQRAIAAADFGNGISRILDWHEWLFVNTDLTVHLHREPEGEWVALDAETVLDANGSGLATSTLHDRRGPIGVAAQSPFVEHRTG